MSRQRISNSDWIRQSFILGKDAISAEDMKRRVLSSAFFKFTDTTVGGNFAINAPPQFTRFADIKVGGNTGVVYSRANRRFTSETRSRYLGLDNRSGSSGSDAGGRSPSKGMGRRYSEAIDDNGQLVTMRFGVPEYNSLTRFFGNFYSAEAGLVARTGKGAGLFFGTGEVIGKLLAAPFFPVILGGRIFQRLLDKPASKFAYLKPAMPLYWSAVNRIATGIAVNMGLTPRVFSESQREMMQNDSQFGPDSYKAYHEALPDLISPDGTINVYAIATRAQRLSWRTSQSIRERWESARGRTIQDLQATLEEEQTESLGVQNFPGPNRDFSAYMKAYNDIARNKGTNEVKEMDGQSATLEDTTWEDMEVDKGSFFQFLEGERRDGSAFVTFRVDYQSTVSESFQNSKTQTEIANKFNSTSSANRMTRINFANGNISDGPIGQAIEGALGMASNVVTGILSGFQLQGLMALAGSALVDIPDTWESSTASLPRQEYTIQLRSPYGNTYSRFVNLMLPLSMLLAAALPRATGKSSYTAPFHVESHCRGRSAIRFGLIDNLSITRGVGNKGWTNLGAPLGIDVSFSIVDLSSIMYAPLIPTFSTFKSALMRGVDTVSGGSDMAVGAMASMLGETWDDDNTYTDYLGVLGNLSMQDMMYPSNRWRLNVSRILQHSRTQFTAPHIANWFGGTLPGRVLNAVSLGTDRR